MTIYTDTTGQVGIGTQTPGETLDLETASGTQCDLAMTVGSHGLKMGYINTSSGYGAIANSNTTGGANNKIEFGFGAITSGAPAQTVMKIDQAGSFELGGSGASVTTILDEDTMSSDSATALCTQQSIKAYVDSGGASAPAKVWVIFNGTGTVAILDSFNTTSITDNSTGNYTVTFATDFATANFAPTLAQNYPQSAGGGNSVVVTEFSTRAVGSCIVKAWGYTGTTNTLAVLDPSYMSAIFFGDQ